MPNVGMGRMVLIIHARIHTHTHTHTHYRTHPVSEWGVWCPVALHNTNTMVKGQPKYAARYCGRVFLLSSSNLLDQFLINPKPYLLKRPIPPRLRVMLVGPPSSGKTAVAKHLSMRYSPACLCVCHYVHVHVFLSACVRVCV
jgi:hypothetical protein